MISKNVAEAIHSEQKQRELYSITELQRTLFSHGYGIPLPVLTECLKVTGWLKLKLIRERLLEIKRQIPKHYPFDGLRRLIKWPLLVERDVEEDS